MLLLQVSIMIMVFVTLHGNFDQEIWNLDDQDAYHVGATTRASMYGPEDTFGCKVCSVGKKHCINVCTHCKIGWKKEPFACRKCQFGSKAGKYNCQLCRRNEDIAFEDTTKCRKNESVGIERSQGGTKELSSSGKGLTRVGVRPSCGIFHTFFTDLLIPDTISKLGSVDGKWSSWSSWSSCSSSCGIGFKTKTKKCIPPHLGGKDCAGETPVVVGECDNTQNICPGFNLTNHKQFCLTLG